MVEAKAMNEHNELYGYSQNYSNFSQREFDKEYHLYENGVTIICYSLYYNNRKCFGIELPHRSTVIVFNGDCYGEPYQYAG